MSYSATESNGHRERERAGIAAVQPSSVMALALSEDCNWLSTQVRDQDSKWKSGKLIPPVPTNMLGRQ